MDAVVWITGNVGSEVDFRTPGEELVFAKFRLASTPRVFRGGEWADGATTWIEVNCTKLLAENVRASVRKGDPVVVVGRLRTVRWEDAERGPQERLRIDATAVGHDLTRGVARFRRNHRPGEGVDPATEIDAATETDHAAEVDPAVRTAAA